MCKYVLLLKALQNKMSNITYVQSYEQWVQTLDQNISFDDKVKAFNAWVERRLSWLYQQKFK